MRAAADPTAEDPSAAAGVEAWPDPPAPGDRGGHGARIDGHPPAAAAPPGARLGRALASVARGVGRRLVGAVLPVALGVWWVGGLDVLTTLGRGGGPALLLPAHMALVLGGLALGLGVWLLIEALHAFGVAVAAVARRVGRRWGWRGPAPSAWPAVALGGLVATRLFDAHSEFVKHEAGAWVVTGYATLVCLGLGLGLDRLRRWLAAGPSEVRCEVPGEGQRRGAHTGGAGAARLRVAVRLGLLAIGLACVAALHHINSHYFTGLYPPLHRALTGVEVVGGAVALALALAGVRLRWRLAGLVALALSAGVAAPFARLADARPAVYFFGTELRHVAEQWAPLLDRDGDGVPGLLGGTDCDDANPAVHPLAFEVPGNGVDDNCRLGDRVGPPDPPVRLAPVPPDLEAWRAAHPKPNVLLVFIDTWRADHFTPEHTPNLWRLAQRSVRFTQARTTAPRTPMAWMSLIRGRFLGRCLSCRQRLVKPDSRTLVEGLQRGAYRTYGRLIGQSWKRYHAVQGYTRLIQAGRVAGVTGPAVARDARNLLQSALKGGPGPFFLVAHFTDPHAPHVSHPSHPAVDDSLRARYASEVRFTDHQVGTVLAELEAQGQLENTVVVVFADHGENLGEHGDVGGHHGVSLFDEVVHIPLMFHVPGVPAQVVHDAVSIVDLAPTVLDLAGLAPLPGADGRSLAGHFFGAPPPPAPTVSEFYDFGHRLRAVVFADHKLVVDAHHGVRLLFDLKADPGETNDLLAARPEVAAVLQGWLDRWVEHAADPTQLDPAACRDLVPRPATPRSADDQ